MSTIKIKQVKSIKVKVLSLLAKKFVESLVNQPVLNNHLN